MLLYMCLLFIVMRALGMLSITTTYLLTLQLRWKESLRSRPVWRVEASRVGRCHLAVARKACRLVTSPEAKPDLTCVVGENRKYDGHHVTFAEIALMSILNPHRLRHANTAPQCDLLHGVRQKNWPPSSCSTFIVTEWKKRCVAQMADTIIAFIHKKLLLLLDSLTSKPVVDEYAYCTHKVCSYVAVHH